MVKTKTPILNNIEISKDVFWKSATSPYLNIYDFGCVANIMKYK